MVRPVSVGEEIMCLSTLAILDALAIAVERSQVSGLDRDGARQIQEIRKRFITEISEP